MWWAKINNTDATFAPTPVGDLILVAYGDGLVGLDAKTGEARWTRKWDIWGAEKIRIAWQVVSDGEHAYAFIPENMPKEGLSIYSVNLKNGRPRRLVGPIRDLDGAHGAPAHALIAADGSV
ncbi:hypothetical protein AB4212_69685, partial [Streptomyces sp. 2MCAF27]